MPCNTLAIRLHTAEGKSHKPAVLSWLVKGMTFAWRIACRKGTEKRIVASIQVVSQFTKVGLLHALSLSFRS